MRSKQTETLISVETDKGNFNFTTETFNVSHAVAQEVLKRFPGYDAGASWCDDGMAVGYIWVAK